MLLKYLLSIAVALSVVIPRAVALAEEPPSASQAMEFPAKLNLSDDERVVLERYIGHATRYAGALTAEKVAKRCQESPEMFAWEEFPTLAILLDAFQLTGDTRYLDQFKQSFSLFAALLTKGDDGYLGWYGKPIPLRRPADNPEVQIDELQMNFRAIAILSRWVELARTDRAYAQANEETIKEYLSLIGQHLFPKWDARGFFVDLGAAGGTYRGLDYPLCRLQKPGATLPFEKSSIVVDGLLALYRVTGDPRYMDRAVRLGVRYKHCLTLRDGHYEWMSWDPAGSWDADPSKPDAWIVGWIAPDPLGEWYAAAVSMAVNLHQYGLVFDDEDIARFVTTQKTRCWNGDFTKPEYRTVAGEGSAQNKYIKGRFLSYPLALYDPELTRLAFHGPHEKEILQQSTNPWLGGVALSPYVRARYLTAPLLAEGGAPFADYGKDYLSHAASRDMYQSLLFRVVEPGRVTPLKPSQMAPPFSGPPGPKSPGS